MTRGELLELLTKETIKFREHPELISINNHLTGIDKNNMPSKEQIDGVLVAFINHVGISQCIDYALSYKDLEKKKQLWQQNTIAADMKGMLNFMVIIV